VKTLLIFLALLNASYLFAQLDTVEIRDAIGDLNSSAVKKGKFPGSIQLPDHNTSIGFGGFIKTIVYFDSDKENKSDVITPGYFNPAESKGQFGISAKLSRFLFDARNYSSFGNLRGYFEVDFTNGGFNMRHAYANWKNGKHDILAGLFWSGLMDLPALASIEGTGEPSISGVIFNRQAQLRYTYTISDKWNFHISLEDPSSSDALLPAGFKPFTKAPDVIAAVGVNDPGIGHVQLAGIVRVIQLDSANKYNLSGTATALSFASYLVIGSKGRLILSASYGTGLGKYMLGINGLAGYIDKQQKLALIDTYGGILGYSHKFNEKLRTNLGIGTAGLSNTENTNVTFEKSLYGFANIFYQIMPMFTAGIEYIYAESKYSGGVKAKNNRIQLGIQIF
jgi:hypothetical protein